MLNLLWFYAYLFKYLKLYFKIFAYDDKLFPLIYLELLIATIIGIQNIYSSYHQDHYDHLNWVANNLYIENQNDCRVFNLLMDNGIIKLNYDGSLNVYVKSDISSDDLDNLVSLPISEVTYLTVSLKDWNQNIEVFLNNNKINYIRELAFVDAKFRSVDMSLWMDGFSKISRKVTGHIDLYSLKIEPKTFNQFFNELHQSYGMYLILYNSSYSLFIGINYNSLKNYNTSVCLENLKVNKLSFLIFENLLLKIVWVRI